MQSPAARQASSLKLLALHAAAALALLAMQVGRTSRQLPSAVLVHLSSASSIEVLRPVEAQTEDRLRKASTQAA